jgi:hypothetical protein
MRRARRRAFTVALAARALQPEEAWARKQA